MPSEARSAKEGCTNPDGPSVAVNLRRLPMFPSQTTSRSGARSVARAGPFETADASRVPILESLHAIRGSRVAINRITSGALRIVTAIATHRIVHFIALLGLCAAYLQGGGQKLLDFNGAVSEAQHFGLAPAVPIAIATIVTELGASVLILSGTIDGSARCGSPGSLSLQRSLLTASGSSRCRTASWSRTRSSSIWA